MCRQAKEIQEQWKPENADIVYGLFFGYIEKSLFLLNTIEGKESDATRENTDDAYSTYAVGKFSFNVKDEGKHAWYSKEELTWLPRQDQLIELFGFNSAPIYSMDAILMIVDSLISGKYRTNLQVPEEYFITDSWEQFLLKIVMVDRWSKIWNYSDWVVE